MKCKEVQSMLMEWLDGHIDSMSKQAIDQHLKTCETCSREALELRQIMQVMEGVSPEMPSAALRENFSAMLQSEQNLLATNLILEGKPSGNVFSILSASWVKVAAAVVLFALGFWIGNMVRFGKEGPIAAGGHLDAGTDEIRKLQNDVKDVKEALMFNLLTRESASERIRAVNYAEEIAKPDSKVLHALINTLNTDKNVNVRLASLYSLGRFADDAAVRDSLVESLKRQKEPLMQVMLINMLAEKRESRAIKPIQDILYDKKTLKEVKVAAEKGLRTM